MTIDTVSMRLLAPHLSRQTSAGGADLARIANGSASARLGIVKPNETPGAYRPIYETRAKVTETPVTERRDITRSEAVYQNREIRADQAIYEDRAITEQRAIYEDRAVYTERAIKETNVEGNRAISHFRSASQAGIDSGADLAIKVGDGATAVLRFESGNKISVTIGQTSQRFNYSNSEGSFSAAIISAFNAVDGVSASYSAEGKLTLKGADAKSVQIGEVANGWFDWSGSPLAALGLRSGRTDAQVVGSERIQTGTERVQVGTETVVTGSERVQTGVQSVVVGMERIQIGERQVVVGQETFVTGTRKVTEPGTRELVGLELDDAPGVGDLGILDKLSRTTMPAGYVEALFGLLEAHEPAADEPAARSSYGEASASRADDADASSKPDKAPTRLEAAE